MNANFNIPAETLRHVPCDLRGEFVKKLTCGCGRDWDQYQCPSVDGGACYANIDKFNSKAITLHGDMPACVSCPLRTVNGAVVGPPSREEIRALRGLPRKEMTDARAKKLGVSPVKQAVSDTFPRDKMAADYNLCHSVIYHDEAEFQPAIAEHNGKRVIAYRLNWQNSNILFSPANASWEPERGADSCRVVNIPMMPENSSGREDPRLFKFRGSLWLSYQGYSKIGPLMNTVCIGRLNEHGEMDCHFPLHYEHRTRQEKNWVFFENAGKLFCVYQTHPMHVILECDHFNCKLAYATQWKSPYPTGVLRGGASPVLHNGEWYHFFHTATPTYGTKVYTCGVLTFEDKPPFRVLRCAKRPLIAPLEQDAVPGGPAAAVFPCGAVRDKAKSQWHVSYGYMDRECRIASFRFEDIESELYPVGK